MTDKPRHRPGRLTHAASYFLPILAALLLRSFVAEAAVIPSGSMIPTLQVGDRVVMSKLPFGLKLPFLPYKLVDGRAPRRGEVVIFMDPRDPMGDDLVKRVVALGGDLVEMRHNILHINGQPVPRRALPGPCTYLDRSAPGSVPRPLHAELSLRSSKTGRTPCTRILQPGNTAWRRSAYRPDICLSWGTAGTTAPTAATGACCPHLTSRAR